MTKELEGFLDDEEPIVEAVAEEVVTEEPVEPEVAAEPEPEPEPVAEPEPVVPGDVSGLTKALQAERAKRNDYKGERDRLAGEVAAIKAQLDAFTKAPPVAAPVAAPVQAAAPQQIPNPVEDPQGYHAYLEQKSFNDRLNFSEAILREQHDDVDVKLAVFKKAAAENPALRAELSRQPHPYKWAYQQAQKIEAMAEIGTDPAAFRAKVEADIRAKVEAEYAAQLAAQPVAKPRIVLPQSLSTARSSGDRAGPVVNIAESFDDILAPRRK